MNFRKLLFYFLKKGQIFTAIIATLGCKMYFHFLSVLDGQIKGAIFFSIYDELPIRFCFWYLILGA